MKSYTFLFLLLFPFVAAGQDLYHINGQFPGHPRAGRIYLRYFSPNGPVMDSAEIVNGAFKLEGKTPGNWTVARLYIKDKGADIIKPENRTEIWLEPGTTQILIGMTLAASQFRGSPNQELFTELGDLMKDVRKKNQVLDSLYDLSANATRPMLMDSLLDHAYPVLFREKQTLLGKFISSHPDSPVSGYMFEEFAGDGFIELAVVEPVLTLLKDSIRSNLRVKRVEDRIHIARLTAPGMQAPGFSQKDTSGIPVSLSSFLGKWLLIDFWAGWCMPCRAENPELKRIYNLFQKKGFEILGVSLDGERPRWTRAIIADGLTWPQVSDLNIFDNVVARMYGISSIPQNLLVGPDGKIIGWNLRGAALEQKLSTLLK